MKKLIGLLALSSLVLSIQAGGLRSLQGCGQGQEPGTLWGCDACPDGYGSYPGATTCYSCESGSYLADNDNCMTCPTGTYTSFEDGGNGIAYNCTVCPENFTNFGTGNTACYDCKPGQYLINNTYCDACPSGTSSLGGAALNCTATCPAGYFRAVYIEDACLECPTGFYTETANIATSCTPCPANFTNFGAGNTACYNCDYNQYLVSNSVCDDCPYGTSSPGGIAECT